MLDEQADIRRRQRPPTVSNSTDETFSAFSCAGDLLPDESSTCQIHDEHVGEDHDMADIESIAKALARRRGVAPSQVMPQLLDLFGAYTNGELPAKEKASAWTKKIFLHAAVYTQGHAIARNHDFKRLDGC